ncbi:hypothetical protein [Microbacterium awajiense]|uniref:hypothetical protein n=1 Tax=Microbacterium awajiense TaxID=415214 RepID=UPI0031D51547
MTSLLAEWCEGLIALQITDPEDARRDGALVCPACPRIHGRCWEALYPFLSRARITGDERWVAAAVRLYEWSANVSTPDGAWSNDLDPASWRGTTVFGAIALAEALHHHGDLLTPSQRSEWTTRLTLAADGYLWNTFTSVDVTNVNYGLSAIYAFDLIGRLLERDDLRERAHVLSREVTGFLTEPNGLLFGEGKPARNTSERGLRPVDLGYNVEESLNGVVLYALSNGDEPLLSALSASMASHLEFMLPDGGWDNSWGTRQFKWTYWGSRTSDGCQPAYLALASRNPTFGLAAMRNLELLASLTHGGLLHGGPHYQSAGIAPCVHHTFAHAKALAFVVDNALDAPGISAESVLPREDADGVREFPELAVWLAARGPWRATVSAYDGAYLSEVAHDEVLHTMGGALGVVHHQDLGLVAAGSMPRYVVFEPRNQQPNPAEDDALTPRVECFADGAWYTHLYDPLADVTWTDDGSTIVMDARATLQTADRTHLAGPSAAIAIGYRLDADTLTITASRDQVDPLMDLALVVPVISASGERVRRVSTRRTEIDRLGGTLVLESSCPMSVSPRVFNMVPGLEAVPLRMEFAGSAGATVTLRMSVLTS